jgi:hypothetical protein
MGEAPLGSLDGLPVVFMEWDRAVLEVMLVRTVFEIGVQGCQFFVIRMFSCWQVM